MRAAIGMCCLMVVNGGFVASEVARAEEDIVAFAVVSKPPNDKARVSAKVAINGAVTDMKLLASGPLLSNLIWKKLEICHSLKLEGQRAQDEFRITSVRAIDGAMLPMVLQGFAGDCLLKKALKMAPLMD